MREEATALPLVGADLDIKAIRLELGLSQKELAQLVGFSPRAIQSCEQGWRKPSATLEKSIILLLMGHRNPDGLHHAQCWDRVECRAERCADCITYRTQQGHLCWFLHGTLCAEPRHLDWSAKRPACLSCAFFRRLLRAPAAGRDDQPPDAV